MTNLAHDMQKLATLAELVPIGCQTGANSVPSITPADWLAMLPGVVTQLEPAQHEKFVTELLRELDRLGVEMAGCVCDEFVVARNWL